MNALIVGCGRVGAMLANTLSKNGHDVSIVDREPENFDLLDDDFNGITTVGVLIDQKVLSNAGIENCDAFIAVSPDDNVNIMVCQIAREIFNVPKVLARINDPRREDVFSHFGLKTICPVSSSVDAIISMLNTEDLSTITNIGSHVFSFDIIAPPKGLIGNSISKIKLKEGQNLFAVQHEDMTLSFPSSKDIIIKKEDRLIIAKLIN